MADESGEAAAPVVEEQVLDPNDPDRVAARPPEVAIDAKSFFQVGQHADKWSEYDERGVPVKNIKKKKPTKKEKVSLEADYLEASKNYQKYLKDVENWEQAKLDAEKALKKSDRLRWSFRQVGEKHSPIDTDDMETIIQLMGWKALPAKEFKVVKKGLTEVAVDNKVELEVLRVFVREVMPIVLLEERLMSDQLDKIELEDLYSARAWRGKLDADPPPSKLKASARGAGGKASPRTTKKKPTATKLDGATSPRNSASPRGKSSSKKSPSAKK